MLYVFLATPNDCSKYLTIASCFSWFLGNLILVLNEETDTGISLSFLETKLFSCILLFLFNFVVKINLI